MATLKGRPVPLMALGGRIRPPLPVAAYYPLKPTQPVYTQSLATGCLSEYRALSR